MLRNISMSQLINKIASAFKITHNSNKNKPLPIISSFDICTVGASGMKVGFDRELRQGIELLLGLGWLKTGLLGMGKLFWIGEERPMVEELVFCWGDNF